MNTTTTDRSPKAGDAREKVSGLNGKDDGTAEPFKDRSAWLILFGIVQILLGGLFASTVPVMLLLVARSHELGMPVDLPTLIPNLSLYALVAVLFVALGIGSIRARRWARSLTLMMSWIWLACGVFALILVVVLVPGLVDELAYEAELDAASVAMVKILSVAVVGLFHVALPGTFVIVYGSRHVRATCERRDTRVRWTDRCPPRVLTLSVSHALLALVMLGEAAYNWLVPFFGLLLTGVPGAMLVAVVIAWSVYLAWGLYRLRMSAWWGALWLAVVMTASWAVTASRVSMSEIYEAMDLPEEQLDLLSQSGMMETGPTVVVTLVLLAAYVVYLLYVRREFPGPASTRSDTGGADTPESSMPPS